MGRVFLPGRISPSPFPPQGIYCSVCDYLYVFVSTHRSYVHFFGGDASVAVKSSRVVCVSLWVSHREGDFFLRESIL